MKKKDKPNKKKFLKKIFIKICRILGYEIIDQSNFFVPTQNKNLNENLNIQGEKSINLPLGEIKISRNICIRFFRRMHSRLNWMIISSAGKSDFLPSLKSFIAMLL